MKKGEGWNPLPTMLLKWAKNEAFQVLRTINIQKFSDCLQKVTVAYNLKIEIAEIFWQNLFFEVSLQKVAQIRPKMSCCRYQKSVYGLNFIFGPKGSQHVSKVRYLMY